MEKGVEVDDSWPVSRRIAEVVGARTDKPVLLTLCVLDDSPEVREQPSPVGGSSGVRAFMHNWTDRGAHGSRFSRK